MKPDPFYDVIYEAQYRQRIFIGYFPLTWQGVSLAFFCYLLPISFMAQAAWFVGLGAVVYRTMIVTKDYEIERLWVIAFAVSFIQWVEKNSKKRDA